MRLTDREARPECSIIPFHRPEDQPENLTTTSIAAVIAVTILHSDNVSPEEKLLEIIEASGEAEVLDADDAAAEFETFQDEILPVATNDNSIATVRTQCRVCLHLRRHILHQLKRLSLARNLGIGGHNVTVHRQKAQQSNGTYSHGNQDLDKGKSVVFYSICHITHDTPLPGSNNIRAIHGQTLAAMIDG